MVRMLILYATEEGQTAKIATKIAERLRSTGTWVDLYAVDEIPDSVSLEPYERIVIGGSIHAGHFSPKLKKWVKRHAFVLNALPTTFFTVSLGVVENDPRARAQIADIAASLCVDTKWQPGRVVHFGGALAYSKYGWLKKRIMRSIAKRAGHLTDPSRDYDYTDWDDVAKFSDSLVSSPLPRPGISGSAKLSLSLALLLAAGTAAPVARAGEGQPSAEWAGKMRELREVYGELMGDLSSDERFESPKNRSAIEKRATRLAELARSLHRGTRAAPEKDLSIPMLADLFQTETGNAAQMLKKGNRAYARTMLKSIGGLCVACHSRVPGSDFSGGTPFAPPAGSSPVEAGQFYAATRQFDRALREYDSFIARPEVRNVFDFDRAARSALALSVRVKSDPEQTAKLVDRLLAKSDLPYFLSEPARAWKKEVEEWKKEKSNPADSEEAAFREAKRLFDLALSRQRFPADRSADIVYLRASGAIHDFLNRYPRSPKIADALLMLGSAYEVLGDAGLRDFHETYYVACIRISPHTLVSRKCYERYEESVYLGFTGSGGTYIPSDIRQRMNDLEVLSTPLPQTQASPSIRM